MRAEGAGGWISFDGEHVVIVRNGVFAALTGMTGERTLDLGQIDRVILSRATRAKGSGYVQFVRLDDPLRAVQDKILSSYGRADAMTTARLDEYALPYRFHRHAEFQALADAVTAALAEAAAPAPDEDATPAPEEPPAIPAAGETPATAASVPGEPEAIGAPARPEPPVHDPGLIIDQITRLQSLHADGTLTDEEYAAAKARLLRRL